ncbi:MAG: crosslink repair DNA glycosylase YcaQ family protein [Nocardioides sp.]|uniref:winged helix-turn-helix domain-containing protein n=1 Tax=Nocardioides sp. TaxID=35761 RepID=UPI0039E6A996
MESLSLARARRVALAAQGFAVAKRAANDGRSLDPPHEVPTMRTLVRTVERTGVLQVDSVNVLARAHLMPLYSRMGPYDTALLQRAASGRRQRRLVEYWAHVQAFMPVELWPVMAHRMDFYRARLGKWGTSSEHERLAGSLLAELRERGSATARDLDDGLPRVKDNWGWNWSATRHVLDALYSSGDVAIAGRNGQFEILYDLPERVLPDHVLGAPVPSKADADLELVRRAVRSHGVGTAKDLADYYRMRVDDTTAALRTLVETGEVAQVEVAGWRSPAYLWTQARLPRRIAARALLSPFDPVVWHRPRTEALFDFHYRIEIYTPAEKRVHGYYVLPFLLGDRIVARVDLKAERKLGVLLVQGAYAEPSAPDETADELAAELRRLASWLALDDIVVAPRGDLAGAVGISLTRS